MRELDALNAGLRAIAAEGDVLPAAGHAIVDLAAPDIEAMYDQVISGDATSQAVLETDSATLYRLLPNGRPRAIRNFVDGSVRTYFIGTLLERDRSSPIQIAQVGAASIRRATDGTVRQGGKARNFVIILDRHAISDQLWSAAQAAFATTADLVKLEDAGDLGDYSKMNSTDQRAKGSHKANWHMRRLEQEIALQATQGNELCALDGALGNEYLRPQAPRNVIGIAKTFRRDSQFSTRIGGKPYRGNLFRLLADLELGQRTIAFARRQDSENKSIAYFYVRLRPQSELEYPLMGVVKVEVPAPEGPLQSGDLDQLAADILLERNVTPHGRDFRWHAHLYPIYLAERSVKDLFVSEQVLRAMLRWR